MPFQAEYVSSTGNTQQCFDTSLHDLIIRRSATARRKEEKLCKLCLARGSNPAIDDVDEEDSLSEASVGELAYMRRCLPFWVCCDATCVRLFLQVC